MAAFTSTVSTSPQPQFLHFSKKTRNESKLFYVVIKIMPQTELNLYWNQNRKKQNKSQKVQPDSSQHCTFLIWSSLCPNWPKEKHFFAVRYNYVQGPSLLVSEIIFQPQSRGDDVTEEVTRLHGLSHQVNPMQQQWPFPVFCYAKSKLAPVLSDPALNTSWPLCWVWKEELHQILMLSSDYSASKWDTTAWLLDIRHLLEHFRVIFSEVSSFLWLIQRQKWNTAHSKRFIWVCPN